LLRPSVETEGNKCPAFTNSSCRISIAVGFSQRFIRQTTSFLPKLFHIKKPFKLASANGTNGTKGTNGTNGTNGKDGSKMLSGAGVNSTLFSRGQLTHGMLI